MRIEDSHTGEEICCECGLVLDQIYSPSNYSFNSHSPISLRDDIEDMYSACWSEIANIASRLHIDSDQIVSEILTDLIQIKSNWNIVNNKDRSILCSIMFSKFQKSNIAIPVEAIVQACGVEKKDISKYEKNNMSQGFYCAPSSYVNRIGSSFFLPQIILTCATLLINRTFNITMCKQENVAAAAILCIIEGISRMKLDEYAPFKGKITLSSFETELNLCKSSIHRLTKKFNIDTINNILHSSFKNGR